MSKLLNAAACKKYAKERIKQLKPAWGGDRISNDFIEKLEANLRITIDKRIMSHPSLGKTLRWD